MYKKAIDNSKKTGYTVSVRRNYRSSCTIFVVTSRHIGGSAENPKAGMIRGERDEKPLL
jgi:hypothetical protein